MSRCSRQLQRASVAPSIADTSQSPWSKPSATSELERNQKELPQQTRASQHCTGLAFRSGLRQTAEVPLALTQHCPDIRGNKELGHVGAYCAKEQPHGRILWEEEGETWGPCQQLPQTRLEGAYLWRWGEEALQGSPSTGPTLHLASQVREGGPFATAQRLQRGLQGGSGSKEQLCGRMLLVHKCEAWSISAGLPEWECMMFESPETPMISETSLVMCPSLASEDVLLQLLHNYT